MTVMEGNSGDKRKTTYNDAELEEFKTIILKKLKKLKKISNCSQKHILMTVSTEQMILLPHLRCWRKVSKYYQKKKIAD